jgi:Acetyltransferase (GNAT) family
MNVPATIDVAETESVYRALRQYPKIFPHIRHDYVVRMVKQGQVFGIPGTYILYQVYRRTVRLGTFRAGPTTVIIHQIVSLTQGSSAATDVLQAFFARFAEHPVVLTVRADNTRARAFYEKHGFRVVGDIVWKGGTMPGVVYLRDPEQQTTTLPL